MPFIDKEKQREYQRRYQRRRRRQAREGQYEEGASPILKMAVLAVIFFAVAVLGFLSHFDLAGPFGNYAKTAFVFAFGWGALAFPILLLGLGYFLLKGISYRLDKLRFSGAVLLFLALLGILHHAPGFPDALTAVEQGQGGGYIGFSLAYSLVKVAGFWGAWVIIGAFFIIGLLLIFNNFLVLGVGPAEEEEPEPEPTPDESEEPSAGWLSGLRARFNTWRYGKKYNPPAEEGISTVDIQPGPEEVFTGEEDSDEVPAAEAISLKPPKIRRKISIPLDLLEAGQEKPSAADLEVTREKIQKTFYNFGIVVEMDEVSVGPTITQYTFKPAPGTKLARITSLANDLSLALAAHPLRIEAPIPGRSLVGIEVPNKATALVKLKDLLATPEFRNRPSNLSICLGKDVSGKPWIVDLEKMPHLLIAGSTGSGKSVLINSVIISLLYQNSPDDLKIVLVDPKKVELTGYNDIPYLLTPVITDVKKTVSALKWVVSEMERRYQLLSNRGKRNIAVYNAANKNDSLPYIVFIIDELADLMSVAAIDVEAAIVRLAQMSRAVGIHLVLATQRPSVNVLTGLIKANVPSRVAFAVPSQIDSRTIIDSSGAEKLLGRGDMLFVSAELSKPRRLQGAFLSDKEIERVVNFLKDQGGADYQDEVTETFLIERGGGGGSPGSPDDDDLYAQAREQVVRAGKASASLLQRRLRVGYARAARLLDLMEAEGVIGPADGARPRDVLVAEGGEETFFESEDHFTESSENNPSKPY